MTLDDAVRDRQTLAAQLFDALAAGTSDGIGITRASYGEGEAFACMTFAKFADELGMAVDTDAAGNLFMTLAGRDRTAPPVVIGSHLDSVAQGGNFDGAAGVVSGLVACAALMDAGITPTRDVRVMGIRAEESAWFGVSYIGSRAALGQLPAGALANAKRADTGVSLAEHMRQAGCDPDALERGEASLPPGELHAYLEVHIEQGPQLEHADIPVGLVTGIRGNRRLPAAKCFGEYSHCGGVPRPHRRDAVIAVAELINTLDEIWNECDETERDFAFTVGKLFTDQDRHAMTIIAGEVGFSLDMRSLDSTFLQSMEQRLINIARDIEDRRAVRFELGEYTRAAPGAMSPIIQEGFRDGIGELGIQAMDIASGASHDAAAFAAAGVPTAMLFIRNANGSHNPDEAMDLADFTEATRVLSWWLAYRSDQNLN
ncbi:MAG: Zn-dependent hydrolase [Chromatiales bacterium]|jgi:beta-ureidopropionase / N-carbamoyl-L-amino-acid hydrolase|nr:Zn-dependent hydrolase [Chromatiales bacterium]